MHVISDKLRYPSDTNAEQCMSYGTSCSVLHTLKQNNACHIGQATMPFRHQHRTMHVISEQIRCPINTNRKQCMSYRTSYDVLQTLETTIHNIPDKLRFPSHTNTEQCMSCRTSYNVHQTLTQNNACISDKTTMSFRH